MNKKDKNYGVEDLKKGITLLIFLFKVSVITLIIIFCISGFFILEKSETAIILRLGILHKNINKEGLSFALPKPIDNITKISKHLQKITDEKFMYKKSLPLTTVSIKKLKISPTLTPGIDNYLITKDQNIIHLQSDLTYQISDPLQFSFNTKSNEKQLIYLLNNLLVKKVANKNFNDVFLTKNFSIEIKNNLQKQVNKIKFGIEIISLSLQIFLPKQVKADYTTVIKQRNKTTQLIAEAHSRSSQLRTQGINNSLKIISDAQNLKINFLGKTKNILLTLEKLKQRYDTKSKITKTLILYERIGKILKNVKQIIILPEDHKELRLTIDKPQANFNENEENNEK